MQNIGKILNTPEIYKKTQDEIFKNGKRFFFFGSERVTQNHKDIQSSYINI